MIAAASRTARRARRSRSRSRARASPAARPPAAARPVARSALRERRARARARRAPRGAGPAPRVAQRPSTAGFVARGGRRARLEPLAGAHDRPARRSGGRSSAAARRSRAPGGRRARSAVPRRSASTRGGRPPDRTAGRRARGRRPTRPQWSRPRSRGTVARRRTAADPRAAAPPRDHDHLHVGARVQRRECAHDLRHCALALHRRLREHERAEARRARALRITSSGAAASRPAIRPMPAEARAAASACAPGRRDRRRRAGARLLDAREQRAVPRRLDAVCAQRQLGALVVERHLSVHLDALALDGNGVDALERPSGPSSRRALRPRRIAQREEGEAELGVVAQVADLALDPQRR